MHSRHGCVPNHNSGLLGSVVLPIHLHKGKTGVDGLVSLVPKVMK